MTALRPSSPISTPPAVRADAPPMQRLVGWIAAEAPDGRPHLARGRHHPGLGGRASARGRPGRDLRLLRRVDEPIEELDVPRLGEGGVELLGRPAPAPL